MPARISPCPPVSGMVVRGADASWRAVLMSETIHAPPSNNRPRKTHRPRLLGLAVRTIGRGSLPLSGLGAIGSATRVVPRGAATRGRLLGIDPEHKLRPDLIDHEASAAHVAIDHLLLASRPHDKDCWQGGIFRK